MLELGRFHPVVTDSSDLSLCFTRPISPEAMRAAADGGGRLFVSPLLRDWRTEAPSRVAQWKATMTSETLEPLFMTRHAP